MQVPSHLRLSLVIYMHTAKLKFLRQHGFVLAPRCPSVCPGVGGDFMVINRDRTYASVGYDAEDLVCLAVSYLETELEPV